MRRAAAVASRLSTPATVERAGKRDAVHVVDGKRGLLTKVAAHALHIGANGDHDALR